MSKTKMRCITCGKWFQSANAKEVTCPECTLKARKEKLAAKNAPPAVNKQPGAVASPRPAVPPPPKPKPTQSGTAQWLDTLQDVKVGEPDQPPVRPKLPTPPPPRESRGGPGSFRAPTGPGGYREGGERGPGGYREGGERGPGGYREGGDRGPGGYREGGDRGPNTQRDGNNRGPAYRVGGGAGLPDTTFQRPRQPSEGGFNRGPRPDRPRPIGPREGGPGAKPMGAKPKGRGKPPTPRPITPPKPKREKTPPPLPFVPTPEQITQVEERYIELATPIEFDGIRTRIAHELGIPKKTVKKIVKELRDRQDIPSWWELQTYKGSSEELEGIKNTYLPLLPVPEVGIHKQIAEQLTLKPGVVYQAIKAIRLEMNLPQYNDPVVHGSDFVVSQQKRNGTVKSTTEETPAATETTEVTETAEVTEATKDAQTSESADAIVEATSVVEETAPSEV